jgi:hypothetical protein
MKLPRFSLRLLLLAVAVLCVWLARERGAVMERKAAIAAFKQRADFIMLDLDDPALSFNELSPIRRALGDDVVEVILLLPDISQAERARLAALFPEATIYPLESGEDSDADLSVP